MKYLIILGLAILIYFGIRVAETVLDWIEEWTRKSA